jgi:hypothetical protein
MFRGLCPGTRDLGVHETDISALFKLVPLLTANKLSDGRALEGVGCILLSAVRAPGDLAPWNKCIAYKLTVAQFLKKFLAFRGQPRHWSSS